jgi:hypothetical protein
MQRFFPIAVLDAMPFSLCGNYTEQNAMLPERQLEVTILNIC